MKNKSKFLKAMLATALAFSTMSQMGMMPIAAAAGGDTVVVSGLKVNNLESPMGIDTSPVFSWQNTAAGYGRAQTAYRIIVSSTEQNAQQGQGDVWDSGKTTGANNYDITYGGPALSSRTPYYWKVMVWDEQDAPSVWSDTASFETGLFNASDWTAKWIGAPAYNPLGSSSWIWLVNGAAQGNVPGGTQYFRKSFTPNASKTISKVTLNFSADDYGDVYINGQKCASQANVGGAWMNGTVADITASVTAGQNTLAAAITNSSTGFAGFICNATITYTDGSQDAVNTDATWKVSASGPAGWQNASFNDASWSVPDQAILYGQGAWGARVTITQSAPMLRRTFSLAKDIKSARAYMCGLGFYDLRINGQEPDDTVLNPTMTQYNKTVAYRVYDVTSLLQKGSNAVGVELGRGWMNETTSLWNWQGSPWFDEPKMIMQIEVTFTDGTKQVINSDESWKAFTGGPTTYNSVYYGEVYDARLEVPGWTTASFSDSAWSPARLATAPTGTMKFDCVEPMRRVATQTPTITKLSDGAYVIKVPTMTAGWAKLSFHNVTPGKEILISYGETIDSTGHVPDFTNHAMFQRTLEQYHYIAKGGADESFEPRFSYAGYQYIEVDNYTGDLTAQDVACYTVHNDVATTSTLDTSSALINQLHENEVRTILNNYQGKPTDTPVWEKNGYTGDNNVTMETMAYSLDISAFIPNFINDVADTLTDQGIPEIAPSANWAYTNDPVWNTVFTTDVYNMYHYFGQTSLVSKYYDRMRTFAEQYATSFAANGWVGQNDQNADWASPTGGSDPNVGISPVAPEGNAICATAYVYNMFKYMAEMAEKIGKAADAAEYRGYMTSIYNAFNAKFYVASKQIYDTGWWKASGNKSTYRQTSNLVPLAYGLIPDAYKAGVLKNLVNDIIAKNYHLDTGIVGAKIILPVLCDNGYSDVAYRIMTQTTYPSWGYWVTQGATSTWELFENTTRSRDHFFLGTYDEWLFKYMAGIQDVTNGYQTVTVKPTITDRLTYSNASVDTVRGKVTSNWKLNGDGTANFDIVVPFGTTAKIVLPTTNAAGVTLNGSAVSASCAGVTAVSSAAGTITVTAGSGTYHFVSSIDTNVGKHYQVNIANPQGVNAKAVINGQEYALPVNESIPGGASSIQIVSNDSHYTFSNWTGDLFSTQNPLTAQLSGDISLKANFAYHPAQTAGSTATLSLAAETGATVKVNGSDVTLPYTGTFNKGDKVAVDVKAPSGKTFSGWGGDALVGDPAVIVMDGNVSATANFTAVPVQSNFALNAPVTSNDSLTAGTTWLASNLTDGVTSGAGFTSGQNGGSADTSADPRWVEVDLGSNLAVNTVTLFPRSDAQTVQNNINNFPQDFTISVKADGASDYTVVKTVTGHADTAQPVTLSFDETTARYVRVSVTKMCATPMPADIYRLQLSEITVGNTNYTGPVAVSGIQVTGNSTVEEGGFLTLGSTVSPAGVQDSSLNWTVYKSSGAGLGDLADTVTLTKGTNGSVTLNPLQAGSFVVVARANDARGALQMFPITVLPSQQPVDTTALRNTINSASGLSAGDYTASSWSALQTALTAANAALNNSSVTQQQANDAASAVTTAAQSLVDLRALKTAVAGTSSLKAADYTAASWSALQTALTAANNALANGNATQTQVDNAKAALANAVNALQPAPAPVDKTALQASVNSASALKEADYTTASWSALQTALTAANNALANGNATQAQVDTAKAALTNAVNALQPAPIPVDKTVLQASVNSVSSLKETDYTVASWSALQIALTAANNVLTDENATQAQADTAKTALANAVSALVKAGPSSQGGSSNPASTPASSGPVSSSGSGNPNTGSGSPAPVAVVLFSLAALAGVFLTRRIKK